MTATIASIDFDRLKTEYPLLPTVERDTTLKKVASTKGGEYAGACPVCGGKDRFRVQPYFQGGRCMCRQCHPQWMDVLSYVRWRHNVSLAEALTTLGQPNPVSKQAPKPKTSPTAVPGDDRPQPSADWMAYHSRRLADCQHALWHSPAGQRALDYLTEQGYTPETIQQQGLGLNVRWQQTPYGWLPPGIVYPWHNQPGELVGLHVRCPFKTSDGKPDRLACLLGTKPAQDKYMWATGSKPGAGVYGSLTIPGAALLLTEGEKDRDNVISRLTEPANVLTTGSAGSQLPGWVMERLQAEMKPPYILLLADNDANQAGEQGAVRLKAQLEAALDCPVSILYPPAGKDVSDFVLAGGDLNRWLAQVQSQHLHFPTNLPLTLVELLCSFSRFAWMQDDLAHLVVVWWLWHLAIQHDLVLPHESITRARLGELADQLGHPLTESTLREGTNQLVKYGVWHCEKFAHYKESSLSYGCKILPMHPSTLLYTPLPLAEALDHLYEHLFYEVPSTWPDYVPDELVEAFIKYHIPRDDLTRCVTRYGLDGTPYTDFIDETWQCLDALALLKDRPTLAEQRTFRLPSGFNLSNAKSVRLALLRAMQEREQGADGKWQISAAELARRLGVSERSISAYRAAAGLATEQQTRLIEIGVEQRATQLQQVIGQRQQGVKVHLGNQSSYLTPENREQVIAAAIACPYSVRVAIQLASKQYVATAEVIAEQQASRREQYQRARQRRTRERAEEPPPRQVETRPAPPPQEPPSEVTQAKTPGYSRRYTYYHLLKHLATLRVAAQTSLPLAAYLREFGLLGKVEVPARLEANLLQVG